jgi:hypothetical protein
MGTAIITLFSGGKFAIAIGKLYQLFISLVANFPDTRSRGARMRFFVARSHLAATGYPAYEILIFCTIVPDRINGA